MIGSVEEDHQWYGAAHIEGVAAVTRGGLAMSRAAWNQTASRRPRMNDSPPETSRFRMAFQGAIYHNDFLREKNGSELVYRPMLLAQCAVSLLSHGSVLRQPRARNPN